MVCIKHEVYQEWAEDCPECQNEKQAYESSLLTEQERLHLKIDQKVQLLEHVADCLDDGEEQASETDVLSADQPSDCLGCPLLADRPSECSGCPLDRTEHKSDTASVDDRLFLRYLLWKEVHHNGYTEQIGRILWESFPDSKSDTVSVELTRAELDWLRLTAILAPWSDAEDLVMGNRIYAKLEKLSK